MAGLHPGKAGPVRNSLLRRVSTLAAMRTFKTRKLAATAALVLGLLLAPGALGAEPAQGGARVAGPDVPFRSSPGLERRAGSSKIGAGKLRRKLKGLARQAPGASGFFVADLDGKRRRVLFDRKEGKRRKLASNEKLFTTSTALHVLGPGKKITTTVKASGSVSGAGRLKGDLYLIGAGDPSFGAGGIDDLANDVKRAGVRRVTGRVLADDSVFDRLRGVPDSNYGPSAYFAPLSGLVYGGSTYSDDPAKAAGVAFRDRLRSVGVKVGGKVKVDDLPKDLRGRQAIGSYGSPTIAQLAAATNKPSNNFFAEMLLKRLDASGGHRGTTRGGTKDVERYAKSVGSRVSARDGSGLTANNRSSPRDVVDLLSGVRREKGVGNALFDSLSIAGKDGTLASRMNGTVAAGRCRGKTGTISGVSALSGYCKSGRGLVAFSILMNGVSDLNAAHSIQDRMTVQIARYRP